MRSFKETIRVTAAAIAIGGLTSCQEPPPNREIIILPTPSFTPLPQDARIPDVTHISERLPGGATAPAASPDGEQLPALTPIPTEPLPPPSPLPLLSPTIEATVANPEEEFDATIQKRLEATKNTFASIGVEQVGSYRIEEGKYINIYKLPKNTTDTEAGTYFFFHMLPSRDDKKDIQSPEFLRIRVPEKEAAITTYVTYAGEKPDEMHWGIQIGGTWYMWDKHTEGNKESFTIPETGTLQGFTLSELDGTPTLITDPSRFFYDPHSLYLEANGQLTFGGVLAIEDDTHDHVVVHPQHPILPTRAVLLPDTNAILSYPDGSLEYVTQYDPGPVKVDAGRYTMTWNGLELGFAFYNDAAKADYEHAISAIKGQGAAPAITLETGHPGNNGVFLEFDIRPLIKTSNPDGTETLTYGSEVYRVPLQITPAHLPPQR